MRNVVIKFYNSM